MKFLPHSEKQERAIFSDRRITAVLTGIQWGKTRVGAVRTKMAMHRYTNRDDAFLITAPTYKIMQQSTLPAFLQLMDGVGEYRKADAIFEMHGGGICYFRTGTDPDSVVGITNVRHIWCDEAGKYGLYFWENIQARAAFKECPIDLTSSPYARNWVFKEIVKPTLSGQRQDVLLVQAASVENPYFSKAEYERRKATMDPMRFAMMFGGEWGKSAGLVFGCFDESENLVDPMPLPMGTKYFGGIDWGFTEPFVIVVRAITPEGRHYQISEFYKTGLAIHDQIEIIRQKHRVFGIERFYCGHERPEYILELNRQGIPAVAADHYIQKGNDLHYELIKTRKYKVFRGTSPYTLDEYETYHYPEPEDLGPDDDAKEQLPVGQYDHCMSANRFITQHTYKSELKLVPKVPDGKPKEETQEARLRRLYKTRREHAE